MMTIDTSKGTVATIGTVQCTTEDYQALCRELKWWVDPEGVYPDYSTYWYCNIEVDHGENGIIKMKIYQMELIKKLNEQKELLPMITCPLEEVPLYINIQPELTLWRLKIAK